MNIKKINQAIQRTLFSSILMSVLGLGIQGTIHGVLGGELPKNVNIITSTSGADGGMEVSREILVDCIQSLPNPNTLEAVSSAKVEFVRHINGEKEKDDQVQQWTAKVEIPYTIYQREMVIVSQRSVQGQGPVTKEVDKRLQKTYTVESDPSQGDSYGGRSNRVYYFSSADAAEKNAKEKAAKWIKQNQSNRCVEK